MDFSEKDAARSKWKLTQRHRRGRGRGGAVGRGAGRGGRGGGAAARDDLGSNEERYFHPEEEEAAAAAALGPVQQSQGADLAQLLAQAEPFDRAFYYRTRASLIDDVGPPPAAASHQGLSFDLKGLATCLELLPRNAALDTDAFSGSEAGEEAGEEGEEEGEELPDLDEEEEVEEEGGGGRTQAAAVAPRQQHAAAVAAPPPAPPSAAAVPQPLPLPEAAAPAGGHADVDDLLSELLGEKAAIHGSSAAAIALGKAAVHGSSAAAVALTAAAAAPPPPAAPQLQRPPAAPVQQQQRSAAADECDNELDMLLGMGSGAAAAASKGGGTSLRPSPAAAAQQQSLDEWLDDSVAFFKRRALERALLASRSTNPGVWARAAAAVRAPPAAAAMAPGLPGAPPGTTKIKGGRWTVFRFFLVSVAFTSAWVAVSSQLGYYRAIHGPAVLLQLNIAYFLPSIPLLLVSAFLDKPLEARLGVAKTILVRLLVGLVGYGAVTAWFPFMPEHIWYLLGATIALGLFSGIAFSASYQLVARFANKNVIALGLGCSASGPLVLALQIALRMGPTPTRHQQTLLYGIITLVIAAGLWATVSLLLRHWKAIEAASGGGKQDLTEPLLQAEEEGAAPSPRAAPAAAAAEMGAAEAAPPLTPPQQLRAFGETLWRQRSLPPLAAYSSLEPYDTFLSTDQELPADPEERAALVAAAAAAAAEEEERDRAAAARGPSAERQLSAPPPALREGGPADALAAGSLALDGGPAGPPPGGSGGAAAGGAAQRPAGHAPREGGAGASASLQALRLIWAPLAALALSSTIALTLFPFFTYVPSTGTIGELLPKVLFFTRIFADVLGRFLPRLSLLAAERPTTPLLAAGAKLAGVPIFLLYLKSPQGWHSDVAAVAFVGAIWLLGGYINTMSNMLAPRLVPPHLKSAAAGAMAIAYQIAHFLGLATATLLVYLMFGSIHVGDE